MGLAGRSVSLSLSSSSSSVLSWLKKGMEKVVPQPVPSGGPAQSTAAGPESPAQVLLGLGAEVGRVGGHCIWALCPHLSICPGRQEHRHPGSATLGAQVRP